VNKSQGWHSTVGVETIILVYDQRLYQFLSLFFDDKKIFFEKDQRGDQGRMRGIISFEISMTPLLAI